MSLAAPLLLMALAVSAVFAYPTKNGPFYDRTLPDTRNLDGIGSRGDGSWPADLIAKSQEGSEKGDGSKQDFLSNTHLDGIGGGNLMRGLEVEGGGNLLRDLEILRNQAAYYNRNNFPAVGQNYYSMESGAKRAMPSLDSLGAITVGSEKRNMDEIDRSSFNSFIKKNFDEIDRSGFGGFVKRNFDEIDRSGFGGFVKRTPVLPHD